MKAVEGPDPHLSRVLAPHLREVLAAELPVDARKVWRTWLDGVGFPEVTPQASARGVLRAVLPASVFPSRFGWSKLGSFEIRQHTFLQLWCDEPAKRRQAVLERAGAMVRAGSVRRTQALAERLADLAGQLEIATPDAHELEVYARSQDDDVLRAALNTME